MRLAEADHAKVSAAVAAAEATTSGEIVPVVTRASDVYADVALLWSAAAALLAFAVVAAFPDFWAGLYARLRGGWHEHGARELLTVLLVLVVVKFAVVRLILNWTPLLMALTPASVKSARVRARALSLFRAGAEQRTIGSTGVLLYLSLAEHRAEIVAEEGIHARVAPEMWGEAMAELISAVRDGRTGDGIAGAIGRIGAVLAEHFPRAADDRNELPDRLIEL